MKPKNIYESSMEEFIRAVAKEEIVLAKPPKEAVYEVWFCYHACPVRRSMDYPDTYSLEFAVAVAKKAQEGFPDTFYYFIKEAQADG